jgi:hypothetical protein
MALIHPRWDLLMFLVNWFVCFIAVVLVAGSAGVTMTLLHKVFLGTDARFSAFGPEGLFYAVTTILAAVVLYAALTYFGPLAGR